MYTMSPAFTPIWKSVQWVLLFCIERNLAQTDDAEHKLETQVEGSQDEAHPRNIPVLASLKEVSQRVIVRDGDGLHTQTPPSSHPPLHYSAQILIS